MVMVSILGLKGGECKYKLLGFKLLNNNIHESLKIIDFAVFNIGGRELLEEFFSAGYLIFLDGAQKRTLTPFVFIHYNKCRRALVKRLYAINFPRDINRGVCPFCVAAS